MPSASSTARSSGVAVEAVEPAEQAQLLAAGHPAVRPRILLEVAEVAPHAQGVGRDVDPGDGRPPAVARVSPASSRSVVVLPAPFGPSSPNTDPAGTSIVSPSSATMPPG